MGFGTEQQLGNRQTSLADIFRGSIGAPQPVGTTQQPNQLFDLLQRLLGGQGGGAAGGFGETGIAPPPSVDGGTMLSSVTAQPMGGGFPGAGGFPSGPTQGTQLTNPLGSLIDQKFIR